MRIMSEGSFQRRSYVVSTLLDIVVTSDRCRENFIFAGYIQNSRAYPVNKADLETIYEPYKVRKNTL